MTERKTIPLVEPEYFDEIIRTLEEFDKEALRSRLSDLRQRNSKREGRVNNEKGVQHVSEDMSDSYVDGYIWYARVLGLFEPVDGRWKRTELGDRLQRTDDEVQRKDLWLEIVRRDRPFRTYFDALRTPQPLEVINRLPNPTSGKYLNRWAQWLGVQAYGPCEDSYVVILSDYRPTVQEFFETLSEGYERLSASEFAGVPRYDVSVPQLRYAVCTEAQLRPITFDHMLKQVVSDPRLAGRIELSGARYERFWKWKADQPLRLQGVHYYFVRIYPPREVSDA